MNFIMITFGAGGYKNFVLSPPFCHVLNSLRNSIGYYTANKQFSIFRYFDPPTETHNNRAICPFMYSPSGKFLSN